MIVTTASAARRDLWSLLEKASNDFEIIEIASKHGRAVLIDADEFYSLAETEYLRSDPRLAAKLDRAVAEYRAGTGVERDLL